MDLSHAYTVPACNMWVLDFLDLEKTCFFWKHKLVKCPYLWQVLHWYFFAGHWKPSTCKASPHFWHLSLFLWTFFESKLFLLWYEGIGCLSLASFLWLGGLGFTYNFFFLCLLAWRSVCWCHIRLICTTWGSHATCVMCLVVAFKLSIFLASCLTLFAGNLSRSILLSFMVLDTNSSYLRKNQKISLWRILAVSGGFLARASWLWTALYHSSTDLFPCWKLVRRSNWDCISFD